MSNVLPVRLANVLLKPVMLGLICVPLLASAQPSNPMLSGPSVLRVSDTATLTGHRFAPGTSVTVMVQAPDGSSAGYGAMVSGDGSLRYAFAGAAVGAYSVTITDSTGKVLAKTQVNFAR